VVKEYDMTVTPSPSEDLGAVFSVLRHSLRSYLRRQVKNTVVADDLLQDVFVKVLTAINANRAPTNLPAWLYAVARTAVADFYRSSLRRVDVDEAQVLDTQVIDDEYLHRELATCLKPLALQLPAIYRDTLIATDFDGRTMQSVADELRLSVSAIKSRASRGRMMLKEKLLDCCHVEMANGVVVDYNRRSASGCGEQCV
jgi:RNA polymerase sigma-70 factor (ECF subfamily)